MKTFKMGAKNAAYLSREELEAAVGFSIVDYITLALGIKAAYKTFDAVVTDFDGEVYIAEGLNITPVGVSLDIDKIVDTKENIALDEYFARFLAKGEEDGN